jgi:hypothetical protein
MDKVTKYAVTIVVVICLVSAGLFTYNHYYINYTKDEQPEEKIIEQVYDDRICPLVNQGLYFELLRIRHRGLLDKIMKPGTSWRQTPNFYYIINIDGNEFVSKDVEAAGGAKHEELLITWDTMGHEHQISGDVEEEQPQAQITLTIFERKKTGLLSLTSKDVEQDKIELTYDFRTGRWHGDDYFKDKDGYGHYVSDMYEIWFNIYQNDKDEDSIPYWTEVNVLGTDPWEDDSKLDPDGDGVPTSWEWKWGYDPFVWDDHRHLDPDIDGLENIEEHMMRKRFANPYSPDIYIEVDGMERGGLFDWDHILYKESQQIIIERYRCHGINVYFDDGWPDGPANGGGELLPFIHTISQESGMIVQYYKHHFPEERRGVFRYVLVTHNSGFNINSRFNVYDTIAIDSSKQKMLKNRMAWTPRAFRLMLAAPLMHELGHSVGIARTNFEGCDNLTYTEGREALKKFKETWGQYYSVMNYYYFLNKDLLDYSDGSNGPPYDQNDWELLFLPTFQIDSEVIEEPGVVSPGPEAIVRKNPGLHLDGWELDESLTEKHSSKLLDNVFVYHGTPSIRVYRRVDDESYKSTRDIRVYAKPRVDPTYTIWVLVGEGTLDSGGKIQLYSIEDITNEVMDQTSK